MLPSLPQIPAPQKRKKSIKQMAPHSLRPMFKVLQEFFCKILHYLAIILQETLQEGEQFCKINMARNMARVCNVLPTNFAKNLLQ
jgi:hypothetical protein